MSSYTEEQEKTFCDIFGGPPVQGPINPGEIIQFAGSTYKESYCRMCETEIISCLEKDCLGTTCNGGGCDKCHDAFVQYQKNLKNKK